MVPPKSPTDQVAVSEPVHARVARLTKGQWQCLELINEHLSSKEIAVRLNISPHTVDQRVRQALQILGVEKRGEAARLVAAAVREIDPVYQRLIHQPPYIDDFPGREQREPAVGHLIRQADRAREFSLAGIDTEQRPANHWAPLPLPIATRSQPSNQLSLGVRLLWIVLIAIGAAFSAGVYLAGLESLSRMLG